MALSDHLATLEDLRRRGKPTAEDALAALETIIARGQAIADAVAAYEAQRTRMVAVPFAEVLATTALIDAFLEERFADLDYPPTLFVDLRSAAAGLFSLQALRRAFASQASATGTIDNVFVPDANPFVPYRVRQHDTLERIALACLGDVERAWEILDINHLAYPFFLTDRDFSHGEFSSEFEGGEFLQAGQADRENVPADVKVPGDLLWLPSDARVPDAFQPATVRDVELYGRDLDLTDGVPHFAASGELGTVEGIANMQQALRLRIGTRRGELVLHPAYGMETLLAVGIEGTFANVSLAGIGVARTVMQDPRVSAVRDGHQRFSNTINAADMTVRLIGAGGRDLAMNLVLPETVGGPG